MSIRKIHAAAVAAAMLWCCSAFAQVDINKATEAELDGIRGIGPATTRRILQERARQPFADWSDFVARVRGVGAASAARFSDQGYTINGQAYARARPAASNPAQ